MRDLIPTGSNRNAAFKILQARGFTVVGKRGTGEQRICHPAMPRPILISKHRKDLPVQAVTQLNRALARLAVGGDAS